MLEVDDSHEPERRDDEHDRWLAMQSAYAEYKRASEALECTPQFADDSPTSERLRLSMLQGQQRVAFERYVEARMEFLEFWFDGRNLPGTGLAAPPKCDTEYSPAGSWLAFVNGMPVLQILAVILLWMTAFSLIREQKHVRDLEAARNELRATLNQTRDGLQLHGQKLDTWAPPQHPAIPQVEHTPPVLARRRPDATLQATGRKPSAEGQWRHQPALDVQPKQVGAKRAPVPGTQRQRRARTYYSFSLVPSRQFKRVGPVKVSVRSVDAQRKCVSLSILSDRMQIDVPRLQPNQAVWINVGYHEQPLKFVVDRIAGNRLDGHLVEPRINKAELRASQLRFNASGKSL
jgi:hypothetical protein